MPHREKWGGVEAGGGAWVWVLWRQGAWGRSGWRAFRTQRQELMRKLGVRSAYWLARPVCSLSQARTTCPPARGTGTTHTAHRPRSLPCLPNSLGNPDNPIPKVRLEAEPEGGIFPSQSPSSHMHAGTFAKFMVYTKLPRTHQHQTGPSWSQYLFFLAHPQDLISMSTAP